MTANKVIVGSIVLCVMIVAIILVFSAKLRSGFKEFSFQTNEVVTWRSAADTHPSKFVFRAVWFTITPPGSSSPVSTNITKRLNLMAKSLEGNKGSDVDSLDVVTGNWTKPGANGTPVYVPVNERPGLNAFAFLVPGVNDNVSESDLASWKNVPVSLTGFVKT